MKSDLRAVLASSYLFLAAGPLAAQTSVFVGRVNYESPSLAAPVLILVHPTRSGNEWMAGVFGWTLAGSWSLSLGHKSALVLAADVTPLNAHSSNYIYRDGERD